MSKNDNVISLSKFRKKKARAEKEADAAANRTRHGRTKGEKARDKDAARRRDALLDGSEIDD